MSYDSASRVASLSLGMLAAGAALAGVDLAARSPIENGWLDAGRAAISRLVADAGPIVNRAAKSDRGALLPGAPDMTTIAFQPRGLGDVSVVVRLPAATAVKTGIGTTRPAANSARRPMIACEPTVSPLATAVRNLAPGRCIT